jgi:hypothetical protein
VTGARMARAGGAELAGAKDEVWSAGLCEE